MSDETDVMPTDAPSDEGAFALAFLQRRKKGKFREVEPPRLVGPVADTHAHLQMLQNPGARLARCTYYGVKFICAMADPAEDPEKTYDLLDSWIEDAAAILKANGMDDLVPEIPHIRIAIGCHPHNAKHYDDAMEERLLSYLHDPRTVALGEVGLDYHYDLSPRADQRRIFARQIQIAQQADIPLILHMREAHEEGLEILEQEGFPKAGVLLHCFNLDEDALAPWAEAGCYIAYGGPLTFKKADEVRAAAPKVPVDRLLTETDSPYMTPEPMRGMECGPEHVIFTVQKLLEVRGCDSDQSRSELLDQIYGNAIGLLDRKPTAWQLDSTSGVSCK